jgi:ferredoxin-NADP reductase/MOSC domain-containing protein YiiM
MGPQDYGLDRSGEHLMQLAGIAAGKTKTFTIRAGTVKTAYIKTPIAGRCYVNESGLEGNETAVHPDALYAIACEHYEYWALRLGADRNAWPCGHFAENLTISGLDESKLRIGDIIAIGDEVELVVAGPRIPCFKLAWRLGMPDTFIREFGLSGRSGVYFGVRRAGWIESGLPVKVIHTEPAHPTVAEVAVLILDSPNPDSKTIRMLLALPYLSRTSSLMLEAALMRVVDQLPADCEWNNWRAFTLLDVIEEFEGVKSFVLTPEDGLPLPKNRAGQFVTVKIPLADGQVLIRPWSLSDFSENPCTYRLTVKHEAGGHGSSFLHDIISVGSQLHLTRPAGRFILDRTGFMPIVLIGAGIGITPLLAMAKAHVSRGASAPPMLIIHCVRSGDAHPLKDEILALTNHAVNLKVRFVYSQPTQTDKSLRNFHRQGHLTADDVVAELNGIALAVGDKQVEVSWFECDFYLCGPESFLTSLKSGLIERGARKYRVFSERFHSAGAISSRAQGDTAQVEFARSRKTVRWTQSRNATLLELSEEAGLSLPSGCRIGACSSCQCEILEGDVQYESMPIAPIPDGTALLCCARPSSEKLVLAA